MKLDFKSVLGTLTLIVTLVAIMTGYIYNESCASRTRDTEIMGYVVEKNTFLTNAIVVVQREQMALLTDLKVQMTTVQKDVEHIRENGG